MFLLDFGLGGPQQHLMEMANRLQRFRLTEAHTAAGTKAALSGNSKLIMTHLKKEQRNSLCSFGR